MERDTVANPLLQTLSLISGYGQFRFEFTYTDYYREYTEVNFSTKNRFFFPSIQCLVRSARVSLYLSDGMRDRRALTTAVLTTDRGTCWY